MATLQPHDEHRVPRDRTRDAYQPPSAWDTFYVARDEGFPEALVDGARLHDAATWRAWAMTATPAAVQAVRRGLGWAGPDLDDLEDVEDE
jgi:hypothetical protein